MPKVRTLAWLLVLSTVSWAACGDASGEGERREIVVSAASSLTDAFEEMATAFKAAQPGHDVTLNLGASSALAAQIRAGAPADVFASADLAQMDAVRAEGDVDEPRVFATNELVVAVPADSEAVQSLEDLAKPGIRLVLAAPEVPAGGYARELLERASTPEGLGEDFGQRALANLRSEEANVRAVLTKVQLGEADAGIVYRTDLAAAGAEVETVEVPEAFNVLARYAIAEVSGGDHPEGARAFVDFVMSAAGQAILARHGFGPPEAT